MNSSFTDEQNKDNIISSLKGTIKDQSEKIMRLLKEIDGLRKITAPKVKRKAFKGEIISIGRGTQAKFNELEHYYNCIQTILHDGRICSDFGPVRTRRESVWNYYQKDGFCACFHCNKPLLFDIMTVEHLNPQAKGGGDEMDNLRPSCAKCNRERPCIRISEPTAIPPESFLLC